MRKVLVLLMLLKKILNDSDKSEAKSKDVNLIKYGLIKELNFTIILLKNG